MNFGVLLSLKNIKSFAHIDIVFKKVGMLDLHD
jgi:hypothetical protein